MSKRSELRPGIEENLLSGTCSYVVIYDITSTDIDVVQFIQEQDGSHGAE